MTEDELADVVMRRLLDHVDRGFVVDRSRIARGVGHIRASVPKYLQACKVQPHVVLIDLDRADCPARLLDELHVRDAPSRLLFRIAVREVESWVMADGPGFARFASIGLNKIPVRPDDEADPKQCLINLVRRSLDRRLRDDVVPSRGSLASKGPRYNERLAAFVREIWNVDEACARSHSLARTVVRMQSFLR